MNMMSVTYDDEITMADIADVLAMDAMKDQNEVGSLEELDEIIEKGATSFRLIIRIDCAGRKKFFRRATIWSNGRKTTQTRRIDGDTFDMLLEAPGCSGFTMEC